MNSFTIETDDGFGGKYQATLVIVNGMKQFKQRSTSEQSASYVSDADFENEVTMNLGYYESKLLSNLGFTDDQINYLHNLKV